MNILHLMPYSPDPPIFGGALRMHHLLNHLAERHQVTLACFGTADVPSKLHQAYNGRLCDVYAVPYPLVGRHRRLGQFISHWTRHSYLHLVCRSGDMQSLIDRLLSQKPYDVVQSEFSMMGSYRFGTRPVKILDAHNVEYDIYRRMTEHAWSWLRKRHYDHEYRKLRDEEREVCRAQDAIFVTSARDKELLDSDVPHIPKFVVPNGVDLSYFKPSDKPGHPYSPNSPYSIVFTGLMGYVPNYDGILHFLDATFPLIKKSVPQATVTIVGNKPPRELVRRSGDGVTVTGLVGDVRPYVWNSSVYVVPLRMGGGTRLKVLEAMAMKKPIVTTTIGCEGIDVRHGESVLVADSPRQFADAVVSLFQDRSLRDRLTRNGYELVRQRYDWSVIGDQVDSIYQLMLRSAGRKELVETYDA